MDSGENIETSNSFVVVTIKKTSWGGSKKFEDIAFENTQTFSLRMARSSLFHSMIADGKKVFLKKLCLVLVREIQSTFLVAKANVKTHPFLKISWW